MVGMPLGIIGVCVLTVGGGRAGAPASARQARSGAASQRSRRRRRHRRGLSRVRFPSRPRSRLLVGVNAGQYDGSASANQHRLHAHKEHSVASLRKGPAPPLPPVRLSRIKPTHHGQ